VVGTRCVLLFISTAVISASAFAQTQPNQINRDAERNLERLQQQARDREETFRKSQLVAPQGVDNATQPEEKAAPDISVIANCVRVQTVSITGMKRYKRQVFETELNGLVGSCTTIETINAVLRQITNRYIGDGYVTSRAVIGPQDLTNGALEIIIIESQLDNIIGNGLENRRAYRKGELATAFPNLKDRQFNLRDIEQGIDQLARLPSAEPSIDVVAGSLPATSDLVVIRKRVDRPIRGNYVVNNDGQATTGRIQATASVDFDSPLGIADFWSLYYTRDLEGKRDIGSKGYGAFVSVPYGYTTVTLTGGRFQFESILQGNDQAFANTGDSINGGLTVDRLIFRDARTKLSVSAGLSFLDTVNRIQDIKLVTSSYRLVSGNIFFRVQRRFGDKAIINPATKERTGTQQGRTFLSADIGVTRGFDILGANAVDTGDGGARVTFRKIEASIGLQSELAVFNVPLKYSGVVRGQTTLDPVFPAERFSLGGSSTIRGFRDDGISGRTGVFTRQQIGFGLFSLFGTKTNGTQTEFSGFVGYDAGGILPRKDDPFERGFLQSATLGLRFGNKRIESELALSAPISAPNTIRKRDVEFSASVRLVL
jgi:hemolysin activation/secretion protein